MILSVNLVFAKAEGIKPAPMTHLFDYSEYHKIKPDNIKYLEIVRYTEAGQSIKKVEDKAKINEIYTLLKHIVIFQEVNMSCTDNTTIYRFTLNDNSKVYIEIECNWLVIKGKSYAFFFDLMQPQI